MKKAFKCNLCNKFLTSQSNLNIHILNQHEGLYFRPKHFKCNLCQYAVHGESELIKHMRTHTGERPFKCKVHDCGKAFTSESNLKTHIKYKHSDVRPFKCKLPSCLYAAKTSGLLNAHMKVHSDGRPYACPNSGCSYRAKCKTAIAQHFRSLHGETKPFACTQCDYRTARRAHFNYHVRRRHSDRDFKCSHPQCKAAFSSSYDLKRHLRNVHEEKNKECDHPGCGRKYSSATELKSHKFYSHSMKKIACPIPDCSYRTNTTWNLKGHMIKHDERSEKIPCPIKGCEYELKNRRALLSHTRRHATKTLLACPMYCGECAWDERALQKHVQLHNPVGRPFQCPLCWKYYPTQNRLTLHSVSHTKEKPFRCGHCEFATSLRSTAKSHATSQHTSITFPFIILPLDHRECLHCKMTLPLGEFIVHCMAHAVPVVMLERLETRWL